MAGKISTEILSHFNCEKCQKWWSIGDADLSREKWFCPWCGHQQTVLPAKPLKSESDSEKERD